MNYITQAIEVLEKLSCMGIARHDGWLFPPKLKPEVDEVINALRAALAQPVKPVEESDAWKAGYKHGAWSAQPAQPDEINFCARCGKRQGDYIHTCTPPRKATRDEKIVRPGVYEVREGK